MRARSRAASASAFSGILPRRPFRHSSSDAQARPSRAVTSPGRRVTTTGASPSQHRGREPRERG